MSSKGARKSAAKKILRNKITIFDYNASHLQEKAAKDIKECVAYRDTPTVTWINIDRVPPANFLTELGLGFDLHPVILGDILNVDQRPKAELMDDYVYVVLKMLYLDKKTGRDIVSEQVSIIIAPKFVLSFQQGVEGDVFEPVRERIRRAQPRIRESGTDYLGYKLLDAVVDEYFKILEKLGEDIEKLENELISNPTPRTLRSLHGFKRRILDLRKSVWPLREVVNMLVRGDSPLIKKSTQIYLRDVYEHTVQVIDTIETCRDMLSGMMDIYLSSVSNRLNSVMKVLTIITVIFMPLTFLTGMYGMNFKYMPGLEWLWGFPVLLGLMLVVFAGMLAYFKKKGWL